MKPIYYDTETTGIRPDKDRIIELAAYDATTGRTFQSLINPGMPIPQEATSIHGITDDMVLSSPSFAEVGRSFAEFCGPDAALIAHNNEAFDKLFLQAEYKRHQLEMPAWPMIDSLKWARKYRSDLPRHHLQFLRQIYGIPENQAHRALDDVMVLYQVFSILIDDLSMETVLELLSSSSTIQHMPFGKYQGKPLKEIPPDYIAWLKQQGALDKPENANLKQTFKQLGLLTVT